MKRINHGSEKIQVECACKEKAPCKNKATLDFHSKQYLVTICTYPIPVISPTKQNSLEFSVPVLIGTSVQESDHSVMSENNIESSVFNNTEIVHVFVIDNHTPICIEEILTDMNCMYQNPMDIKQAVLNMYS